MTTSLKNGETEITPTSARRRMHGALAVHICLSFIRPDSPPPYPNACEGVAVHMPEFVHAGVTRDVVYGMLQS